MTYHSAENKEYYFPPLLSNGDISFAPDAEGMLGYTKKGYEEKHFIVFDGIVVRAARRSAVCTDLQARLFPLGKFTFNSGSPLSEWSQTLEAEQGIFESDCKYSDGTQIHSVGFIHPDFNIYALRKSFEKVSDGKKFSYDITLSGYNDEIDKYMNILYTTRSDDVCRIGFKLYGMEVFCGEIRVFTDKQFDMSPIDNGIRLTFDVKDGEEVSFYYYVEDDADKVDFCKVLEQYEQKIRNDGFLTMLDECKCHYREFYDLGYVKTSDDSLNEIYKTALYNIKCSTTKYSVAVGLNNGAWDGRYFAFDEYTSFFGLLTSNRLQLAKRVPSYRLNNCLNSAIQRASDCHKNAETEDMARFHWECGEKDNFELSPDGNWLDHIFHIPLVGMGAFEYYEYSEDKDFLRSSYKMIRACAKFITKHMLYKDGDRLYIGKCTDLERLGSSAENPFMTACGAVRLLQYCSKAAKILGIDEEYAAECEIIAQKLTENLPVEDNRYVPILNCKQKSIAVFAGKFPFDVIESDDEKLINAWDDFENNGSAYGNMYPIGNKLSPWYACWKAIAYARAGRADKAYSALVQAYSSVGVFSELFEIKEDTYYIKPWFTTASGIFVAAVDEMLLQTDKNIIKIMPGIPHSVDASFKLAAKGGITVEAEIKGGSLIKAAVFKGSYDVTEQFKIEF